MIGAEDWVFVSADVKGDIYEGLFKNNAADAKSGVCKCSMLSVFIKVMVECLRAQPGKTIVDPACGIGGLFLAAHDYLTDSSRY